MNKRLLILMLAPGYLLQAQITITKNDMPSVSDTLRVSIANTIGASDPTLTDTNYLWDYSHLNSVNQRIDTFVSVSSTPFLYQLYFNNQFSYPDHKSNLAVPVVTPTFTTGLTVTDVFNYFKNITGEYTQTGFGANINGLPSSVRFDSLDIIYKFPMNYGNTDSCVSKYELNVPSLLYYGQRKKRVNEVDGWGTLKTPFGTFQTLRIKSTLYITDTIYISSFSFGYKISRPTEVEYKWLAPNGKIPLLQVNTLAGSIPVVTSVSYRDSVRGSSSTLSIMNTDQASAEVNIFPSPASSNFTVDYKVDDPGTVLLEVYDMLGNKMELLNTSQTRGSYQYSVNVSALKLASSVYIVKLSRPGKAAYVQRIFCGRY